MNPDSKKADAYPTTEQVDESGLAEYIRKLTVALKKSDNVLTQKIIAEKRKLANFLIVDSLKSCVDEHSSKGLREVLSYFVEQKLKDTDFEPKRRELIVKLHKYIDRINSYAHDDGTINFAPGFRFFKNSRAANREANYFLSLKLFQKLVLTDASISEIFEGANTQRDVSIRPTHLPILI